MNPLTNVKNITKLNETELASGLIHKKSWHDMYKDSAWVFIGGLQYGLTEGDILTVFSQYGEIVNINLVRDKKTGKSKGFCFLCFSNQKSTILAVDNFNGIKLCNRTIRVDHVANYKPPKEDERDDEITKMLKSEGCAPDIMKTLTTNEDQTKKKKLKKEKKEKKKKKKHNSDASDSDKNPSIEIKKEKYDPEYDKYDTSFNKAHVKKIKLEKESSWHKEIYNDSFKTKSSSKSHKRERSSSPVSDNTSRDCNDTIKRKYKEKQIKDRHSKNKRKYKDTSHSSSSSSDDDSSAWSSSDNQKSENKRKYSRKDKHRASREKESYHEESRFKHYERSEDSIYESSKSRHHDKIRTEKYSDHRSKDKHRNYDRVHENSDYYKRKHDKR